PGTAYANVFRGGSSTPSRKSPASRRTARGRRTIHDVARLAGVHPSTVSRALTRTDLPLRPETRRKVQAAVERLGYRPSVLARGLRLRRTSTLGMLVPDITNPFFPPIIRGAEEAARARGYEIVLCNTDDSPQREDASLRLLRERQADGLLIATSRMADATLDAVRRERFPFVLVNRGSRVAADLSVEVDNERAAASVVDHLVGLGHRRICRSSASTTSRSRRSSTRPSRPCACRSARWASSPLGCSSRCSRVAPSRRRACASTRRSSCAGRPPLRSPRGGSREHRSDRRRACDETVRGDHGVRAARARGP